MITHLSLNKVSTLIAVIGALYMQFFLRDSAIDDKHLYTPIISQENPIISKVNGKLESKKHLFKALRSIEDLTSFLNSRCYNFPSYFLIKQIFFLFCVIIIHVWCIPKFPAWLLLKQQLLHSSIALQMLAFMDHCWYIFFSLFVFFCILFKSQFLV